MTGLFNQDKTLKKNQLKDVQEFVLADGYDGYQIFAKVTSAGHTLVDAYQATSPWIVNVANSTLAVTQSTSPWVVSGTVTVSNPTSDAYFYKEDDGHTSGDYGRLALTVRNDLDAVLTSANLDYSVLAVDAYGHLKIDLFDGYANKLGSTGNSLNVNLTNIPTVNQGTSPWVVSGTVTATAAEDKNYGTVGANTLRTASQVGNATGAADFNRGATTAQTLRVTNNTSDGYGNLITSAANSSGTKRPLDTWDTHGTPQHFNGVVGTSATTLTPSSTTTAILVFNPTTNASNVTLSVSFDSGTTFFDLIRGATLSIECEVSSLQIKGSSATTNYQILVTRR